MQLVGIAMVSTILCIVIKKDRPEMANFVALTAGIIILLSVVMKLSFIVDGIQSLADKVNIPSMYISLIIKLIGICYIIEFAISLCNDCGKKVLQVSWSLEGK